MANDEETIELIRMRFDQLFLRDIFLRTARLDLIDEAYRRFRSNIFVLLENKETNNG